MSNPLPLPFADCTRRCHSKKHGDNITSVLSKCNLKQFQAYFGFCHNTATQVDCYGRNALHVASSCGKWEIVAWLLIEKGVDTSTKDAESHWSALHRSLFYGQLSCARILISHGASIHSQDREKHTPIDQLVLDRPPYVDISINGKTDVYTWGDNTNFTLGHGNEMRHHTPNLVDTFTKAKLSVVQVELLKFHSVFRTSCGRVFTCGHGRGGRLGHMDEQTKLVPKEVPLEEKISFVAAGRDNTAFLTESGLVFTCGLNTYHQLGLNPPPSHSLLPKQVVCKLWKGKHIEGIAVGRFHTAVHTNTSVYTFGLNAGQLGHQKGEKLQSQPRIVSPLNHKDIMISSITCSDGATIVITKKGEVFVLHEYQCRKITTRLLDIKNVCCTGGHLDLKSAGDIQGDTSNNELIICFLTHSKRVFLWKSSDPTLRRCTWSLGGDLAICDISLTIYGMVIVTDTGQAYIGHRSTKLKVKESAVSPQKDGIQVLSSIGSMVDWQLEADDAELVNLQRVLYVHRAVAVTADKKGRNFAVVQSHHSSSLTELPNVSSSEISQHFKTLMSEADSYDVIHDVTIQVENETIFAHKFILASRSEYFKKLFTSKTEEFLTDAKTALTLENTSLDIFLQLLTFLYTDNCDLLTPGAIVTIAKQTHSNEKSNKAQPVEDIPRSKNGKPISAHQYNQKLKKFSQKDGKVEEINKSKSSNPTKLLQEMAKRFGVKSLVKRLDAVCWNDGTVTLGTNKHLTPPSLRLDRTKLRSLYDVEIKSEDGLTIKCHKCVLVARLEYFHSMLATGWVETSSSEALSLPVPGDILTVILDFLYTDDSAFVRKCEDAELICNILVVADQLLIGRLKDICEMVLSQLITLKNATELLEFASVYNSQQLKSTCQQYICLNLPTILEMRVLEVLSDDVIDELTTYYRNMVPEMCRRIITPFDAPPDICYLESIEKDLLFDIDNISSDSKSDQLKRSKSRKRRGRTKSQGEAGKQGDQRSEGYGSRSVGRQMSISSETSDILEDVDEILDDETIPLKSPLEIQPHIVIPSRNFNSVWSQKSPRQQQSQSSPTMHLSPVSPLATTGYQGDGDVTGTSPPVHMYGLRDIMLEEAIKKAEIERNEKTKLVSSVPRFAKLSQKERKKLQHKRVEQEKQDQHKQIAPASAWGNVNTVVQSFKDLMVGEDNKQTKQISKATTPTSVPIVTVAATSPKTSVIPPKSAHISPSKPIGSKSTLFSWGLPTSSVQSQKDSNENEVAIPTSPPENPWQRPLANVAATKKSLSFSDIVHDEMIQKQTHDRTTNKPLHLIQIEEQAILELLEQYKQAENFDERISIQRVAVSMAAPTWAAHTKQNI
ncbi:unnamed protein product [Owenia fusiformis]|uniref:Uncharacterized protein n=1 Tax=Owenia fusiformis TaxID=6347 RepID=A0A8J1XJM5_OWEFU|nr:unnamed protein product [Owenia fusiformis]